LRPELRHPDPPLADDVVLLRPWHADDNPERLMAFADPVVLHFNWPESRPYTEDDARRYFAVQQQERIRGVTLSWAFVEPSDATDVLGGGSLNEIDLERRRCAIGYWVRAGARGRGIATHAARLMTAYAFEALRVERVELTTDPENAASMRVAERCGFVRERLIIGDLPWKGGLCDTVVFARHG
jgi:RimJ/RimL family protein N-acetyltransferase